MIAAEQLEATRAVAVHLPPSAAASSSSAAPHSAFAVLGETQRLKNVLRAAELRATSAEKVATVAAREADRLIKESEAACVVAYAAVEEAKAALAMVMHGKRQRVEEEVQQGQEQVYHPSFLGPPHSHEVHPSQHATH